MPAVGNGGMEVRKGFLTGLMLVAWGTALPAKSVLALISNPGGA